MKKILILSIIGLVIVGCSDPESEFKNIKNDILTIKDDISNIKNELVKVNEKVLLKKKKNKDKDLALTKDQNEASIYWDNTLFEIKENGLIPFFIKNDFTIKLLNSYFLSNLSEYREKNVFDVGGGYKKDKIDFLKYSKNISKNFIYKNSSFEEIEDIFGNTVYKYGKNPVYLKLLLEEYGDLFINKFSFEQKISLKSEIQIYRSLLEISKEKDFDNKILELLKFKSIDHYEDSYYEKLSEMEKKITFFYNNKFSIFGLEIAHRNMTGKYKEWNDFFSLLEKKLEKKQK